MIEKFFLPRGYKPSIIDAAFKKLDTIPGETFTERREEALKKKDKEDKNHDRVVVPLNFNPAMPKAGEVLNKHYRAMIRKNNELEETFPSTPLVGFRQPKILKGSLQLKTPSCWKKSIPEEKRPYLFPWM